MIKSILIFFVLIFVWCKAFSQDSIAVKNSDTLIFKGQISGWIHYNYQSSSNAVLANRYIPNVNYKINFSKNRLLDFELAANCFGSFYSNLNDSNSIDGNISAYRAWTRFSTAQLEVRAGLQKINFGSANILRPLMWFDQIDPRDPLKLTNGVWGILGRYYFLNNANWWVWGLYGNNKNRAWDIGKSLINKPEFGSRIQYPVKKGEIALSYHYRFVNSNDFYPLIMNNDEMQENRIAIDGKWDLGVGLWFEGVWVQKNKNIGILTNQEMLCIGADNTFGIGNGLNVTLEQLFVATDNKAFELKRGIGFSSISANYPIGIVDNISTIAYYDWKNNQTYSFINWNHQWKRISMYIMLYANPKKYNMPQQGSSQNSYAGKGFQLMLVYNH